MDATRTYPKRYRNSIRRITEETGIAVDTAFAMMLMTAALMDLNPEDDEVVHMILQDCGIEDGDAA